MDSVGEGEPEFADAGCGNPYRASPGQRDDGAGQRVPHQHHGVSLGIPAKLRLDGIHPGKQELRIRAPVRRDGAGRAEGPAPDREPCHAAAGIGIEREDEAAYVRKAVSQLPPELGMPVMLVDIPGMS